DNCGLPSPFMVASTPSEFPLSRANSLSSKTWRPISRAYVYTIRLMTELSEVDGNIPPGPHIRPSVTLLEFGP
ncbi:MAG: hypothetical protein JWQ31_2904, partial [Mycobacterium sp.]|nr:hypothetical protein [Mycobacterium sp.]